jgi:hypothetical protein
MPIFIKLKKQKKINDSGILIHIVRTYSISKEMTKKSSI